MRIEDQIITNYIKAKQDYDRWKNTHFLNIGNKKKDKYLEAKSDLATFFGVMSPYDFIHSNFNICCESMWYGTKDKELNYEKGDSTKSFYTKNMYDKNGYTLVEGCNGEHYLFRIYNYLTEETIRAVAKSFGEAV